MKNGTLKLDPATLAGKGAETTVNGYLELSSLQSWIANGRCASAVAGNADMPPVNLVIAGSLSDAGAITARDRHGADRELSHHEPHARGCRAARDASM